MFGQEKKKENCFNFIGNKVPLGLTLRYNFLTSKTLSNLDLLTASRINLIAK